MRGTITARGKNTWRLRVDAGRDPVTGRRKVVSKTIHGTKRHAYDQLAALVVAHTGTRPDADVTVRALVDGWLEHVAPSLSPTTVIRYRHAANSHLLPALGDRTVDKVGAYDLDVLYRTMLEAGAKPASVRKVHQVASSAFGQAVKWGWLRENPAARGRATPPKIPRREIAPPTPDVVKAAFDKIAATDPDFATFVHLAAVTGCRRGELCGLRWCDLDGAAATLHVRHAAITGPAGTVVKSTKTDRTRRLRLSPVTVANLATHRTRVAERMLAGGVRIADTDYLFPAERDATNRKTLRADRPTRPDVMTHRWERLRRQIPSLADVRLHDLRHHAATQLIAGGVDVRKVMDRLGWTSLQTAQRYVHLVEDADDQAAAVMERLFGG